MAASQTIRKLCGGFGPGNSVTAYKYLGGLTFFPEVLELCCFDMLHMKPPKYSYLIFSCTRKNSQPLKRKTKVAHIFDKKAEFLVIEVSDILEGMIFRCQDKMVYVESSLSIMSHNYSRYFFKAPTSLGSTDLFLR